MMNAPPVGAVLRAALRPEKERSPGRRTAPPLRWRLTNVPRRGRPAGGPWVGKGTQPRAAHSTAPTVCYDERTPVGAVLRAALGSEKERSPGRRTAPPLRWRLTNAPRRGRPVGGPWVGIRTQPRAAHSTAPTGCLDAIFPKGEGFGVCSTITSPYSAFCTLHSAFQKTPPGDLMSLS